MQINYTKYPERLNVPVKFEVLGTEYDIRENSMVSSDDSIDGKVYNCLPNDLVTQIDASALQPITVGQNVTQYDLDSVNESKSFTYLYLKTSYDIFHPTYVKIDIDDEFSDKFFTLSLQPNELNLLNKVPDIDIELGEVNSKYRIHRLIPSSDGRYTIYGTNYVLSKNQVDALGILYASEMDLFEQTSYTPIFNLELFSNIGLWYQSYVGRDATISGNDDDQLVDNKRITALKRRKKRLSLWKKAWYSVTPKKEARHRGVAIMSPSEFEKALNRMSKILASANMYIDVKYFEGDAPEIVGSNGYIDAKNISEVMDSYITLYGRKLQLVIDAEEIDNLVSISTMAIESYDEGTNSVLDIIGSDVFYGSLSKPLGDTNPYEMYNSNYAALLAQFKYSGADTNRTGNIILNELGNNIISKVSDDLISSLQDIKIKSANETEIGEIFRNFYLDNIDDAGNVVATYETDFLGIDSGNYAKSVIKRISANVVSIDSWLTNYRDIRYRPAHFIVPVDYGYVKKDVQFKCGDEFQTREMEVRYGIRPVLITVYSSRTSIFNKKTKKTQNRLSRIPTPTRVIDGVMQIDLPGNAPIDVCRRLAIDVMYNNYIDETFKNENGIELFKSKTKVFGDSDVGKKFRLLYQLLVNSFGSDRVIISQYLTSYDDNSQELSKRDAMLPWSFYGNSCKIVVNGTDGSPIRDASEDYFKLLEIARNFIYGCRIGVFGEPMVAIWGSQFITSPDMFYWEVLPIGYSHKSSYKYREMYLSMQSPINGSRFYLSNTEQLFKWFYARIDAYGNGFKDTKPTTIRGIVDQMSDGIYLDLNTSKKYIISGGKTYEHSPSIEWLLTNNQSLNESLFYASIAGNISDANNIMNAYRYGQYFIDLKTLDDVELFNKLFVSGYSNVRITFPSSLFPDHTVVLNNGNLVTRTILSNKLNLNYNTSSTYNAKVNVISNTKFVDILPNYVVKLSKGDTVNISGNIYEIVNVNDGVFEVKDPISLPSKEYDVTFIINNAFKSSLTYDSGYTTSSSLIISDSSLLSEDMEQKVIKSFISSVRKYISELDSSVRNSSFTVIHNSLNSSENYDKIELFENEMGLISSQDIMNIEDLDKLYKDVLSGKNISANIGEDGNQQLYIYEETISVIADAKVIFNGRNDFIVNDELNSKESIERRTNRIAMKVSELT